MAEPGEYIEVAGGKITHTCEEDFVMYSGGNIIINAAKSVIWNGEEGVAFGDYQAPPADDNTDKKPENGHVTYLIIYGAGYLNIRNISITHDQGSNFKKNAIALKALIASRAGCDPEQVVLAEARSTSEFVKATNKKYETGKIDSLTVFSHGTESSISLGGELDNYDQLDNYDLREINFKTIDQIARDNFEKSAHITLYGCNIGTGGESSLAQLIADTLGLTVKAFDGPAEAKSKNKDGKAPLVYDGTMIKTADRSTQSVRLTTFTPK